MWYLLLVYHKVGKNKIIETFLGTQVYLDTIILSETHKLENHMVSLT